MFRSFPADADTYVTNRVIRSKRVTSSNVGGAGTLDLFKLYGVTTSGSQPNIEISRLLIHFDLTKLSQQMAIAGIDPSYSSFNARLVMRDVYGGQPTPSNFSIVALPLSSSFEEGIGRDVVYYTDIGTANFLSSSSDVAWHSGGAGSIGYLGSPDIDIIGSGSVGSSNFNFAVTQSFQIGSEDLSIDVTSIVSASLKGDLPTSGFRLSFSDSEETDHMSRFVKRFGSRAAVDPAARPALQIRWDDSISDDSSTLEFDQTGNLFLYSLTGGGSPRNLVSGSAFSPITGSNSLSLRLETPISGALFATTFAASQLQRGSTFVTGTYFSQVLLSSVDSRLTESIAVSGSVTFVGIWCSTDATVGFLTSSFTFAPQFASTADARSRLTFSPIDLSDEYASDEVFTVKLHCVNTLSNFTPRKTFYDLPTYVPDVIHISIRDADTNFVYIPFDTVHGSTKMSSDSSGLSYSIYADSIVPGRACAIDVLVIEGNKQSLYKDVAGRFRIAQTKIGP